MGVLVALAWIGVLLVVPVGVGVELGLGVGDGLAATPPDPVASAATSVALRVREKIRRSLATPLKSEAQVPVEPSAPQPILSKEEAVGGREKVAVVTFTRRPSRYAESWKGLADGE